LRERDLGVATLNQTREALGLTPYTSFDQITSDSTLAGELQQVYGSVDQVDLFVGGLAEDAAGNGSMVGPTFQAVIAQQFENLRDGDQNFFLNQGFSPQLAQQIQNTTLSDLIVRDTDTTVMQPNAFISTHRVSSDAADTSDSNGTTGQPQLVVGTNADKATVAGQSGADNTIVAGLGMNQQLTGGGTSNNFVFLAPQGYNDTITNFNPSTDTIDFENTMTPADFSKVSIKSDGNGGSVVQYQQDQINVAGVSPDQLTASQFVFNQQNPGMLAQQQMAA
jgi:peroxidase